MTEEREVRDRRGRRAIAWGGGIVVVGFALGCALSFLPVATGLRMNPPFALEWVIVGGSLTVGVVGLVFMLYGFVELARARPPKGEQPT